MVGTISQMVFAIPLLGGLVGGAARLRQGDRELTGIRKGVDKVATVMRSPDAPLGELPDVAAKVAPNSRHAATAAKKVAEFAHNHKIQDRNFADFAFAASTGIGGTFSLIKGLSNKVQYVQDVQEANGGKHKHYFSVIFSSRGLEPAAKEARRNELFSWSSVSAMALDGVGILYSLFMGSSKKKPAVLENRFMQIGLGLGLYKASNALSEIHAGSEAWKMARQFHAENPDKGLPAEILEPIIASLIKGKPSTAKVSELAQKYSAEKLSPDAVTQAVTGEFHTKGAAKTIDGPKARLEEATAAKGINRSSLMLVS
jgi:hypothetical protein